MFIMGHDLWKDDGDHKDDKVRDEDEIEGRDNATVTNKSSKSTNG